SRENEFTRRSAGFEFTHVFIPKPLNTFGRHALDRSTLGLPRRPCEMEQPERLAARRCAARSGGRRADRPNNRSRRLSEANDVHLRPLGLADEKLVDAVFDQLTTYSMLAEGVPKVANAAAQFLTELPRGCEPQSKHVFAVMRDGEAVGLA